MLERKGGVHVKGGVISGIHFRYNYFFKKNGLDPIWKKKMYMWKGGANNNFILFLFLFFYYKKMDNKYLQKQNYKNVIRQGSLTSWNESNKRSKQRGEGREERVKERKTKENETDERNKRIPRGFPHIPTEMSNDVMQWVYFVSSRFISLFFYSVLSPFIHYNSFFSLLFFSYFIFLFSFFSFLFVLFPVLSFFFSFFRFLFPSSFFVFFLSFFFLFFFFFFVFYFNFSFFKKKNSNKIRIWHIIFKDLTKNLIDRLITNVKI